MAEVIVNDSGRFLDGYSNVLGAVAVLKSAAEDLDDDALLAVYHHAQQTAKVVERALEDDATEEMKTDAEVRVGCLITLVDHLNDAGKGGLDCQLLYAASVLLELAVSQLSAEFFPVGEELESA